jgi:peptidylprolyl isomerase
MSRTAQDGDKVQVHYRGTLADGYEFDCSREREPLEFVIGQGFVIPGFENGVKGMAVGDTRSVTIPHDQAYGPRDEALRMDVPRCDLPAGLDPEAGQVLRVQTPQGEMHMTVVEAGETCLTLDGNHPLAGKDLVFELELVGIEG